MTMQGFLFQVARLVDKNALRYLINLFRQYLLLSRFRIEVTFVRSSGERIKAKGKIGDTLLDVVLDNELDFDGFGACEGTLTCSTCHLILTEEDYKIAKKNKKAGEEEKDMLDLAVDVEDTSRLGCQIILTKQLNGMVVRLPATINDVRS